MSSKTKSPRKLTLKWNDFEKNILSYGLKKHYDELMKLGGMDYTDRYLKTLEFLRSKILRQEMRHMFEIDINKMTKEWKIRIAHARNDKEIEKILTEYELSVTSGKNPA